MCHNLGGLVWHHCGRIWKMGPSLRWKMWTHPHVMHLQYLDHFSKCSNSWSTTLTNHVSFLITLFYFWFPYFFFSFFARANWGTDFCHTLYICDALWEKVIYVGKCTFSVERKTAGNLKKVEFQVSMDICFRYSWEPCILNKNSIWFDSVWVNKWRRVCPLS